MSILFRLCYIRDSAPRGVTFAAEDLAQAHEFLEMWEDITKCPVLTIKPLARRGWREIYGEQK